MEILAAIGVIAIFILLYFIIQTLISARASLQKMDIVLDNLDVKLNKLTSFVNTIDNISNVAEKETEIFKNEYQARKFIAHESRPSEELATWLISSIKLGLKCMRGGKHYDR